MTYKPTAADWDRQLSVRLSLTRTNFTVSPIVAASAPTSYSVTPSGTPASITYFPPIAVDSVLNILRPDYKDSAGNPVNPTFSYQWLREGQPIAHATLSLYVPGVADVGKHVSVRMTANVAGLAPSVITTDPVGPVLMATFDEDLYVAPQMADVVTKTVRAELYQIGFPEDRTTVTYQWYRRDASTASSPWTRITGATKVTYTLNAAVDYNHYVSVLVSVSRPGWVSYAPTLAEIPAGGNWSHVETAPGYLSPSVPRVGVGITAFSPHYIDGITGNDIGLGVSSCGWLWYRDGVRIKDAWEQVYGPTNADRGHFISVKVECYASGRIQLPYTLTTSARVPLAISGSHAAPTVSKASDSPTLTAKLASGSITTSAVALQFQWLRDGTPIAGATASTYVPVAADWNTSLAVRIAASKSGYDTEHLPDSSGVNVSVTSAVPVVDNPSPHVGQTLTVLPQVFHLGTSGPVYVPASGDQVVSWYVDGTFASTGPAFEVLAEMEGLAITVQVHTEKAGWLTSEQTSSPTSAVAPATP
ncbi:MAG: hypothetical protein ABI632_08175 [Pseudolysinimonas sp.]